MFVLVLAYNYSGRLVVMSRRQSSDAYIRRTIGGTLGGQSFYLREGMFERIIRTNNAVLHGVHFYDWMFVGWQGHGWSV